MDAGCDGLRQGDLLPLEKRHLTDEGIDIVTANAGRPNKARALRCRQDQSGFRASWNSSRNQSDEPTQIASSPQIPSRRALLLKRSAGATQILKPRGHDPLRSPTLLAAPAHA